MAPRLPAHLAAVFLGLGGCAVLAGCGGASAPARATTAGAPPAALPALATDPRRTGEVILRGDGSPRTHGPIAFAGRYRVRFAQYAPEDAGVDFAAQTSFVVELERAAGIAVQRLLRAASASGERTVTLRGRYLVDVTFGDFPYILRFTPAGR